MLRPSFAIGVPCFVHRFPEELGEAGALLVGWEGLGIAEAVHRLSTGIGQRRGKGDGLLDPQGAADAAEMGVEHIPPHRGIAGQRPDWAAQLAPEAVEGWAAPSRDRV